MATGGVTSDMDILSCSVCFEDFNTNNHQPKGFPCQHTVCQSCVSGLIQTSQDVTIDCPLCRKRIPIPSDGVSGFPNNLTVMALLSPKPGAKCRDHATHTVQNVICMTCCRFLCHKCMLSQKHTSHQVEEATEAFKSCITDTKRYKAELNKLKNTGVPDNFKNNKTSTQDMISTVKQHASSLVSEIKRWEKNSIASLQQQMASVDQQWSDAISPGFKLAQKSDKILQKAMERDVRCLQDVKNLHQQIQDFKQNIHKAEKTPLTEMSLSAKPKLSLPKVEVKTGK